MLKLTLRYGKPIYVAPSSIGAVYSGPKSNTTYVAFLGYDDAHEVQESPEEVVRLIESSRQPADYAPLVDAARRLVEFLRDSDSVVTGYAPVAHALAVALAALPAREPRDGDVEVPRG